MGQPFAILANAIADVGCWRRKDTPEPLPNDYACDVTIPIKSE